MVRQAEPRRKARAAAATARDTSAAAASATTATSSSVTGDTVGKVVPATEDTHVLSMNSLVYLTSGTAIVGEVQELEEEVWRCGGVEEWGWRCAICG